MSNAVSALGGASHVDGIVDISEVGLQGMITLRGDLSSAAVNNAVKTTGCAMPEQRGVTTTGEMRVAWMSPDELLILCPYAQAAKVLADVQAALGDAHALAVNVSDARAMFRIEGAQVREVIAKLAPVDMSPSAFPVGSFRRTRLAQSAAAFHMAGETRIDIVCFRSVARYMFDLLKTAAAPGSAVDYFG